MKSMPRNLFIIATPLHAFIAAEIAFQQGSGDANWFLLTSTSSLTCRTLLEDVGEKCSGFRVIDASWCSPNGISVIPKTFSVALVKARFHRNKEKKLGDIDGTDFDNVFIFSPNALTAYVRYTHPEARFYLAEDGTGTYSGAIERRAYSLDICMPGAGKKRSQKAVDLMNKVLFGGCLSYKAKALYVHCPEMLEYHYDGEVRRIDPGDNFREILDNYARLRNGQTDYANYDCVFLGQPISELCSEEPVFELFKCIDDCGLEWVYRPHPRERNLPESIPVESEPGSWELRTMSEVDNNTCLLSICSTAMGIPKMLFGKEPTLVFLHRLLLPKGASARATTEAYAERLRCAYTDPARVIIPCTKAEFAGLLSEIPIAKTVFFEGQNID